MTFHQHDNISFLNLPFVDEGNDVDVQNSALDDLFLNFPSEFTFDDDFTSPLGTNRAGQPEMDSLYASDYSSAYGDKRGPLDMSAHYTLQTLPRSATMGPNKLAATPSTALALLQRKQQYMGKGVSSLSMPPVKEKRDVNDFIRADGDGDFVFDPAVFLEPPAKRQRLESESGAQSEVPSSKTMPDIAISSLNSEGGTHQSEQSPPAAPVDKRFRNNQASARFRAKKKMREMQVENTARDAIIRAEILERRVKEMEMEVIWLRGLAACDEKSSIQVNGDGSKPRTPKTLKQVYEENGVAWRDGSLQVTKNGPAVSGGPLPPPSWGLTEDGEIFALPVASPSVTSPAVISPGNSTGVPLSLPLQMALPPPAKRGRPPKKLVNIPNVSHPVATLGNVGGVLVNGIHLLPLFMQQPALSQPAKKK
ncbi:hypothetical protein HDU93_000963 [Gonapodya sp. JEL0774]|nr:hypothetical protein HDU93_000963 [Gonapodya sp. JEL0774]